MPVQMWRQIAEAGDVHFLRPQCLAQRGFEREYGFHEYLPVRCGEVGKLLYVRVPDDAAEPGIGCAVGTRHAHYPPFFAANNQFAAVTVAQFASGLNHG